MNGLSLNWGSCERQERREKGILRAAHPHTPFQVSAPPPGLVSFDLLIQALVFCLLFFLPIPDCIVHFHQDEAAMYADHVEIKEILMGQ